MNRMRRRLLISLFLILIISTTGCQVAKDKNIEKPDIEVQDSTPNFDLQLYTDKLSYKTTDKILIWATLKYTGSKNQITIWHSEPFIRFLISDGKDFRTGGMVIDVLASTILEKDKLYRFEHVKSGGFSDDEPNAEFWKKFYAEKDLYLPAGEYEITVAENFSLSKDNMNDETLSKQIRIKVEK